MQFTGYKMLVWVCICKSSKLGTEHIYMFSPLKLYDRLDFFLKVNSKKKIIKDLSYKNLIADICSRMYQDYM